MILDGCKSRRVVAGAMDWPGLDRWGTSQDDALNKLSSYLPRYVGVAVRVPSSTNAGFDIGVEPVPAVPRSDRRTAGAPYTRLPNTPTVDTHAKPGNPRCA